MESLRKRFFDKYNIDAVELLDGVYSDQPSLINSRTISFNFRIINYLAKKGLNEDIVNDEFLIAFIEALTEANVYLGRNEVLAFDIFQVDVPFKVYKSKSSKGVLEDFKPIVGNDALRPQLNGVYVGDGELVGTDAHILAHLKTKEYQEYKGKIIDLEVFLKSKGKSITFIDEKYPNYEAVIPKKENQKIIKDVNIIPLLNYLTGVKALRKNIYNKLFHAVIKFDDTIIAFQNDYLYDAFEFISKQGYEVVDIGYEAPNRPITIYYPKGLILIMPIMLMGDETETGTKTISLNDILDNYSSENQEVITKKTAKKINEKKGVVAEWEDTIATLQDLLKEEGVSESDREEWEMTIATLEELLKEQKMELGGLVMSYSSPQIVEGIGSFTSQFDDGGEVSGYIDLSKQKGMAVNDSHGLNELPIIDIVKKNTIEPYPKVINGANVVYQLMKDLYGDSIRSYEGFYAIMLNKANKPIYIYEHSKGGLDATIVDVQLIMATANKTLAKGIVLVHNHPSGSLIPSDQDKIITKKVGNACKFFGIVLIDHIIVTENGYISFAEEGIDLAKDGKKLKDGQVDEDNLSYAEASKRWNKKAGLPEEGFQGEAIKIVKENPELLMMLEDGGRIYNDDQLELMFDDGGEVKEERSFKDGYEALKRMGIFDDQPKKKTNREKIEEAKNKLKAKN
jgi:DNA repair protein RadC